MNNTNTSNFGISIGGTPPINEVAIQNYIQAQKQ